MSLRDAAAGRRPPATTPARDLVRDDVVLSAQTWVVKVGTSVLTGPDGTLDPARIDHLAEQISTVMDRGRKVALVSSGAVGAGMGQLGWKRRPDNLPQLQAAAAVGQAYLIRAYDEGLRRHRRHAAQLLLTHEDFDSRPRYLNMRNTLHALFECDAVPIINENDTISVDEIKFGDNDRLAAMVTNLLQAPLLVILSVVDGLYRTEPGNSNDTGAGLAGAADRRRSARPGRRRHELARDRRHAQQAGGGAAGDTGRRLGDHRLGDQARALDPHPGRRAGGDIVPGARRDPPRTQALDRPDRAAARPLRRRRRCAGKRSNRAPSSLLAIGIVEVTGEFEKGDVVGIRDPSGQEFARGLTNYATADAERIRGLHTHEARQALGATLYDEVIHRDNLVLIV